MLTGTLSVKAIIRDNRFAQIESALQTGKADGMWTMDKYMSDYIASRPKLTPPRVSFKPSPESYSGDFYTSSLFRESDYDLPVPPARSTTPAKPVKMSVKETPDAGHYVISDDSSVEDILFEIGGKKEE